MGILSNQVLYNQKSKRYEIYKTKDLERLKALNKEGGVLEVIEEDNEGDEGEEIIEGQPTNAAKTGEDKRPVLKKSVINLCLEECELVKEIEEPSLLFKFDMNKVLDADDVYNMVKRKPRTKGDLAIVRPWQNKVMANFLAQLFKEAGDQVLQKTTVINKFNEAGVPLTWARLVSMNVMFERKAVFPPWSHRADKITVIVPLEDAETNLRNLESELVSILSDYI